MSSGGHRPPGPEETPRFLSGYTPATYEDRLRRRFEWAVRNPQLGRTMRDAYGTGALVEAAEERLAQVLGTEKALLFPTGTMAQQCALRIWAQQAGSEQVALHAYSHHLAHEEYAVREVSGLEPVVIGPPRDQITAADVSDPSVRFGVVSYEIPLRERGFVVPPAAEVRAVTDAAHRRNAFVHADGARLWEASGRLGVPLHRIRDDLGFDSMYVALDKSLGAEGAALVGDAPFIEQAQVLRHRYGGRPRRMGDLAANAMMGLDRLPRLREFVELAPSIAEEIASVPGVIVHPNPPHTNEFNVWMPGSVKHLQETNDQMQHFGRRTRLFTGWRASGVPGLSVTEFRVDEPATTWRRGQIAPAVAEFMTLSRARGPAGVWPGPGSGRTPEPGRRTGPSTTTADVPPEVEGVAEVAMQAAARGFRRASTHQGRPRGGADAGRSAEPAPQRRSARGIGLSQELDRNRTGR